MARRIDGEHPAAAAESDLLRARVGEDLRRLLDARARGARAVERMRERGGPDPEADCRAGCDARCGGGRADEPWPPQGERHDVLPLDRSSGEDAVAQLPRRRRRDDREGERRRRLAEARELLATARALTEVGLEGLAPLGIEGVERVGGGQVVDVHDISSPGSPRSSRRRASPMNILLLIVPSGWPSRSASSDCVKPP